MDQLELWGGVECTVNRIGDSYLDQTCRSGHHERLSDIERIASLGIRRLRYPLLWERIAPDDPSSCDWRWSDARLAALRAHDISPIAGLVHHGSGPRYTHLLDPDFAKRLASFAQGVARRYPSIEHWTPVNEPLTTARFSCLYGHWYPHLRDERPFWTALINQIEGVIAAMHAIRTVNSSARLIQTDDLGRTYATARLRDQAAFDNSRRWMTWDLLTGRVTGGHPLWNRLSGFGLGDRLRRIADKPCPPDVIGINHYLTSDRFLDHRVRAYPRDARGGNGRMAYADVEAVRVLQPAGGGLSGAMKDVWDRYHLPIAITEVHNGCTRDEQMRWMAEAWTLAVAARARGEDVRAVTAWALLGSHDWDRLLTTRGRYEAGAFDVSADIPRATAMVPLLRELAGTRQSGPTPNKAEPSLRHPVLSAPGWWRRPDRILHAVVPRPAPMREHAVPASSPAGDGRPLLITGATGTLGGALGRAARARALEVVITDRAALDLDDPVSISNALARYRPWAVINTAGWVRVDDAESAEGPCRAVNAAGAIRLASACAAEGIPTATISSDLVFGGDRPRYVESDPPAPLNVYGRSKAEAEDAIRPLPGRHLIIRTAAFFSADDAHNFAVKAVATLRRGEPCYAPRDQVISPTYVPDLARALLDLVIDGETGVWHLSNGEGLSWADFARRLAEAVGEERARVVPCEGALLGQSAARPRSATLVSERGALMPPLQDAIDRFAHALSERLLVST